MIAGLEVPHVHLHVIPIDGMQDLDFGNVDPTPTPTALDAAADAAARPRCATRGATGVSE